MPIKVYWGPPGSYKTSSAVHDEVVKCAAEGRTLITNIRGLSEQRIRENVPVVVHKDFKLLHFHQGDPDQLARLQRWWHWAPFGAYFILDEVQGIYPPYWTAKNLDALQLPPEAERSFPPRKHPDTGEEISEAVPRTLDLAFDMHRHGNWDFCFTTTNIRKVHPLVRGAAETACRHKNLKTLGMPGRFMQFMHMAEDNGNPSDTYGSRWRKIPKWVFQCYDSTATGAFSDSGAGWSIFANPRVLLLLGLLGFCFALLSSVGLPAFFTGGGLALIPEKCVQKSGNAMIVLRNIQSHLR